MQPRYSRDIAEFASFKDLLTDIVNDRELLGVFDLNTYITGEVNLKRVHADEGFQQFAGRPDWNRIGKELHQAYPAAQVGVFLCGPAAIGKQLSAMCDKFNAERGKASRRAANAFVFHKESF